MSAVFIGILIGIVLCFFFYKYIKNKQAEDIKEKPSGNVENDLPSKEEDKPIK